MPIRPENRQRYPKDWKAISRRIRDRDGNACKWCLAPNGALIIRTGFGDDWVHHSCNGVCMGEACGSVRIVITVAHLDHTPEHCDDDNLVALCQRCHLRYDAKHHASTARATRAARRGQGSLW
jgi:hypothetical protein